MLGLLIVSTVVTASANEEGEKCNDLGLLASFDSGTEEPDPLLREIQERREQPESVSYQVWINNHNKFVVALQRQTIAERGLKPNYEPNFINVSSTVAFKG